MDNIAVRYLFVYTTSYFHTQICDKITIVYDVPTIMLKTKNYRFKIVGKQGYLSVK